MIDNQSKTSGEVFRNSFSRFSLRKKPVKETQDLETKTSESFKKGFRNSFSRLSLRKKPVKETQGSEIKVDKGLYELLKKCAVLEDSNPFLHGLKEIKEAQGLDVISPKQSPLIDVNQKLQKLEDYLLMKPVPVVLTPKMWKVELEKPKFDDSGYQYMN
ncbi:MAG: hypothetical protein WBD50_02950 [Candidatus Rhabdochlamydia sp.]